MERIRQLPFCWVQKKLVNIAPLQRGFDLPNSKIEKGDYPVVYSNGVLNFHSKYMVKSPGVVTGRSGTIGNVTYIEENFWPHNTSLWVTNFKGNYPLFIYYLYVFLRLDRFQTGSGVPTLNRNDVHAYEVIIPKDIEEQRAIATVLSDTDELISSLDKLIEKKQNIKKATMQQLLTGKKRLPGFSGEWEIKTFYEIFRKHSSKDYQIQSADYNVSGKIPVVDQGKKIIVAYTNNENKCFSCPLKGIIVFGDHTRIIKYINFDFAVGADGTQLLSTLNNFSTQYFYYLLLIKEIPNTGYNRHFKFILEMTFSTPTFEEQQAIAQVLSDMDSEIEALEQKRDKYKSIKQGMMQQLLTGKIRLV